MPPESLWVQYSLIGITLLTVGTIAGALYKLWHELLGWIESQDVKRSKEREAQREWEEQQARQRDERWQVFMRQMQERWLDQDARYAQVLERLVNKIDNLDVAIRTHDAWARGNQEQK
ncbi:hypothetical protein C4588_04185 [Candidatus Parcubacteria bacterium]|jgi:molecular chaperone GrpE (heat shock protein)|nr:MAG: hypothetical protein C4588_04185 [Candidatus Parcubacteria bacterium]